MVPDASGISEVVRNPTSSASKVLRSATSREICSASFKKLLRVLYNGVAAAKFPANELTLSTGILIRRPLKVSAAEVCG